MADPNQPQIDGAPITDPSEFSAFLHAPMEDLPQGTGGAARDLLPLSKQVLDSTDKFEQENLRTGVPLQIKEPRDTEFDIGEGNVSPWIRFQTARRQNLADQQKYLESQFGVGKVRKAKGTDDFIVEIPDPETGKPKDVVLNEQGISLGDVAALVGHAPELATSILSMAGVGKLKALQLAPQLIQSGARLLAGAAGYKAGEAGQQIETELEQGQTPDPSKIALEKAKEIPGQAVADLAVAGIFKTASLARRLKEGGPGVFKQQAQKEGIPARDELARRTGRKLEYSAGEASGMPLLNFIEAYAEAKPQATATVQSFKNAQQAEIKAIGDAITSKAGTDEEVGNKLAQFIEGNQKVKQDALDAVKATMTEQESQSLVRQLGKIGRAQNRLDVSGTGASLRQSVQDLWQGVKQKVGNAYRTAYSVPGAADPDVGTKVISDEIDSLLKRFPNVEGVQWLKGYKDTIQPNETYQNIVQRRSDLWNKIETSPADRETKDYVHNQLSQAMTTTLDDAAKNIKDPAFKKLIGQANEVYKKEELPFYQTGIRDVLLKAGTPGSPENVALLDRFRKSTDLYRRLMDVTGKDAPPAKLVKSGIIDGLLTESGTAAIDPKFVDAGKFIKSLNDLATNPQTREMFDDVFGKRGKSLLEQAKALGAIQGNLPKEELEAMLQGGASSLTKGRLKQVIAAQKQLDRVEGKRLVQGSVDDINPEQLVNRYIGELTQSETKLLKTKMERDAPALYAETQDKLIQQILGKAGTYETWNRSNIEKVINDPKWAPKYKEWLGSRFSDLELFAKALGPIQFAREVSEGTGMLVKGESIGALARIFKYDPRSRKSKIGAILEELPPWLGWKFFAKAIQTGKFREWASKDFPPETMDAVKAAVISEPILMDIASSSSSPALVRNLAMSVRGWANRVGQPAQKENTEPPIKDINELRRFLNEK